MTRQSVLGMSLLVVVGCAAEAPPSGPTGSKLRRCAVPDMTVAQATKVENKLDRLLRVEPERVPGSIMIDVHAHVITDGTNGKLTQAQIQSQVDVLSEAYAGGQRAGAHNTAYRFRLASYELV